MNRAVLAGILTSCATAVHSGEPITQHESDPKKATVEYRLYSGTIPDTDEPTEADAKVVLGLTGRAAKDLFNHLGRDRRYEACVGRGVRVRHTPNHKVTCLRSTKGEYQCSISVDLKTGETDVGMVC